MAKQKGEINKSEEIRNMLRANPRITAREVCATLEGKGIKVSPKLYYLVKGKLLGRQAHKKKARRMVAKVAASTGTGSADALSTVLRVKTLANEVGGMKKLRALVEVLSE